MQDKGIMRLIGSNVELLVLPPITLYSCIILLLSSVLLHHSLPNHPHYPLVLHRITPITPKKM